MHSVRRAIVVLLALCVLGVAAAGVGLWSQGYRVYVVHTGSMTPTYKPGDVVIDKPAVGEPRPGQVITFRYSDETTDVVTHRVTEVTAAGFIHTKGDANRTADVWDIRADMVQGTVERGLPGLGFVLVFLKQPAGIGALGCSVLALVMLWSLFFAAAEAEQTSSDRRGRHVAAPASRHSASRRSVVQPDVASEPRYVPIHSLLT